ncbi:sodium/glucose cotransporter 4-like isoform X2 [Limulus polyphemus]|uniref:Sodium/glucose cotransporter 4-like isoform X2 n=1 Tax=Limulus polyphemus TaxID=6850 RepID=A0ABM1TPC6_LIMPO|nr:sodium/glucose cotransporter 4-like isoform X2 [Limulus polyphemus]XP_022257732.1 sodium/glucose cotransporter 4-like isoform X2 [Limulus polyphemus]
MVLEDIPLHWGDVCVIVGYFLCVLGVGLWSSKNSNRNSISGYFLASRNMHWIPVGASLFASNIGSGHFIGLAGSGAVSGIGIAGFELNAMFVMLILGWLFVPVYTAAGVYTMPEYLRKRFGGQRIRIYLSTLALLLYVFTKISADLYAGAIFIEEALKWNLYVAIIVLLAVAAIFTVAGGLTAVIWTDFVQTIIMIAGAFALMVISFVKVGGYQELVHQFATKIPNETVIGYNSKNVSCSEIPGNYMHLLRSAYDPELPWTGMVFGLTISAVWYWCSDQVIVQRVLSAKNVSHAKMGCIVAGYLKFLPMFLLVFPGMAARVLFTDQIGCSRPEACYAACKNKGGCSNIAYPLLVLELMPPGARGLMLSVMLAALMSSLTSIFNSSSTIFTIDIWTRIRKQAKEMELLIVGRVFVLVQVVVSILWIPIIQAAHSSQLFHYIQSVTAYLAPPVCAVYVLAVFWTRTNERGAFYGLMVGLVVGLIRFTWEFSYTVPSCASGQPDPRPYILSKVHYLHFGCILFVISFLVTVTVSLLTQPMDTKHVSNLKFIIYTLDVYSSLYRF